MHKVIDTPWSVADHVGTLKHQGVETIIRYFNHSNSSKLPEKRVSGGEAEAIAEAGLSLATVFQQRGGADGKIGDLDAESGTRDATRAMALAADIGQPEGSAIYFAVDYDYWKASQLDQIEPYFAAVKADLGGKYRVGVYGSGAVAKRMTTAGHVELIWLAAATGWSGTKDMLKTDKWALYQIYPPINEPLPHDGNVISAAWHDYGQFVPGGEAAAALEGPAVVRAPNTVIMQVTARSGLRVRRGPSTEYAVEMTLSYGTNVYALGKQGEWIMVDVQGDGQSDGFMHGEFLKAVSGGLPVPTPASVPATGGRVYASPYDIALAELDLGVKEIEGDGNNPRIVMYHNSTGAKGHDADDDVAWCSSFVNYCVEQAGLVGTDSQWALTWENWGHDVTNDPKIGDIVVFERVGKGGHVGFWRGESSGMITVLGGNQSNQVKISNYPKNGKLGTTTYKLRKIRRA